ncbi:MAG: hypothetical protein KF723_23000 [Rhizobiaceae bacterium]|nr:hypothetical protein [Rhizobiaceae bacterium]
MTQPEKPAKGGGMLPPRPWEAQPERRMLALRVGGQATPSDIAIGWTLLGLKDERILRQGEEVFRDGQTDRQKIAEAITIWKLNRPPAEYDDAGNELRPMVRLYRYTHKSFARSRAHHEGMTFDAHRAQLDALASALRDEGADVIFEVVR